VTLKSRRYAWYVLGLLTTINFINYVDRMVIVTMYEDLRTHFRLTNTQIGALSTAFFLVHGLTTYPLGWASDRWNRVRILALAVICWSLATLGSAYAIGFGSLLVMRSLIGVGEAAYGPISNALIAESFRPEEKARTIGVFNGGMFAGATIGMAVGAILGFPLAFEVVAIPGLALGVLAWFMKVPKLRPGAQHAAPASARALVFDFVRVFRPRTLRWMLASGILISFAVGGSIAWVTDFVVSTKGMSKTEAAGLLGVIALTGGVLGALSGGYVADKLQRRGQWGRTLTIAIGFAASVPFSLIAIYVDSGWLYFTGSWLQMYFLPWYNGPMAAVIDDCVDDSDANGAQAAFAFLLHVVGTGPGSLVVGWASDSITLRHALLIPTAASLLSAVCALVACRYVTADMRSRDLRAQAARAAGAAA
jgi:predicted MFS family arabinose efflux permease